MKQQKSRTQIYLEESDEIINNKNLGIERISEIIGRLTDNSHGCPWDKMQTNESLAKYTIEESYELAEAIESRSNDETCRELGDLLFNILFHIHLATKNSCFTLSDVVDSVVKKMISRHPHVFAEKKITSVDEVNEQWEQIKRTERNTTGSGEIEAELNNIAMNIPALSLSTKIQKKVARVGFDWDTTYQIINKIYEEIDEFIEAEEKNSKSEKLDEIGDILFSVVNLARSSDVEPEAALRSTNRKFVKRVIEMEKSLNEFGKEIKTASKTELDRFWQKIKYGQ